MRILLIDPDLDSRVTLLGRVEEALRRAELRRVELLDGDFELLRRIAGAEPPDLGILGPGCYENLEQSVSRFRGFFPKSPLAVVIDNEIYTSEALELRKNIDARILPMADIQQLAQVLLDSMGGNSPTKGASSARGTIGVIQAKGGVGATSVAAALSACWAEHGLSVGLVDMDDVSPLVTDWALATMAKRRTVGELLLEGEVPQNRVSEILNSVPGYDNLCIVPQPISYGESFHFKADVIDGAPSSAQFMPSLLSSLESELDLIVLDLGSSWGVSVFSALPLCKTILFVFDEDRSSLKRGVETLRRFYRESDDPAEFDFSRWRFVQNGSTQTVVKLEQAMEFLNRAELRQEPFGLSEIGFSLSGRDWYLTSESGEPKTLFELSEEKIRRQIIELAYSLFPFQYEPVEEANGNGMKEKIKKVVSFLS